MPFADKEKARSYRREWQRRHRKNNPGYYRNRSRIQWRRGHPDAMEYLPRNLDETTRKARRAASMRRSRAKVKLEVFRTYGNSCCDCCGETNLGFLTVDHVVKAGKTKFERKNLYAWLKSRHFPPGFRIMCYNCNLGRDKNGGICPYKEYKQ